MVDIFLDGKDWRVADDVYRTFLKAVGAPHWHGHNFNALRDSITVGRINKIEIPYVIKIRNYGLIGADAKDMADNFVHFIGQLHESGFPVTVTIENKDSD
ncbi:MAG TPA: barstar family protein [Candidatus Dormibacteraeota bacterium]|nr:barstar family protein [Candidatus Dormibacteraeota bacterium]